MGSLQEPLRAVSEFSTVFWVLWISELGVLGARLSGGNLKSWALAVGSKPLGPQGEAQSCVFFPGYISLC